MKMLFCAAALLLAWGAVQTPPQDKTNPPDSKKTEAPKKPAGPEKTSRKRVVTNLAGFDLLESSKVEKQPMAVGATRGLPPPVALAPCLGKLYGANPVFAWRYDRKPQKSFFVLTDDAQTEVFRAEASGPEYRYPSGAPPLQPGKTYFWTVEVQSPIFGATTSAPVGLLVVTPAQREEIKNKLARFPGDAYDASLARARILTGARLWYDALTAYADLISRYPDRSELYEQRGTIYAQVDATKPLAEDDFARAEKLQRETKSPDH